MKSARREKLFYVSSRANDVRPYYAGRRGADPYKIKLKYIQQKSKRLNPHPPVSATPTHMLRICVNSRFFFCRSRRKRKSYQKENAGMRFRALRSATVAADGSRRLLKKAGENFN